MNISTLRVTLTCGITAAILAFLSGCAKESSVDNSSVEKEYLKAWIGANHPGVSASGRGIYILEDKSNLHDERFKVVDHRIDDLEGK